MCATQLHGGTSVTHKDGGLKLLSLEKNGELSKEIVSLAVEYETEAGKSLVFLD